MEKIKPKFVYTFTKRTDIEDFYTKQGLPANWGSGTFNVSLILMVGIDVSERMHCRIKCPINPLPIIGWWQVPDVPTVFKLLERLGWTRTSEQPFPAYLLND